MLADARRQLERLPPPEAHRLAQTGEVLLVDTRSLDEQRAQGVVIPGALHHPLSVVAWRLDPDVPTRNPKPALDTRIALICREGYSSTLAALWLRELGFVRATDVVDGVAGWLAAGLPVEPFGGEHPPPAG